MDVSPFLIELKLGSSRGQSPAPAPPPEALRLLFSAFRAPKVLPVDRQSLREAVERLPPLAKLVVRLADAVER
jgi:hypothetical protein